MASSVQSLKKKDSFNISNLEIEEESSKEKGLEKKESGNNHKIKRGNSF